MKMSSDTMLIAGAVAAGLLLAWYSKRAAQAAAQAVNPVNNNNIINRAANAIVGKDNSTSSIGSTLYDWLHPDFANYNPNGTVKTAAPTASRVQ